MKGIFRELKKRNCRGKAIFLMYSVVKGCDISLIIRKHKFQMLINVFGKNEN
jgi:hypothetical protein